MVRDVFSGNIMGSRSATCLIRLEKCDVPENCHLIRGNDDKSMDSMGYPIFRQSYMEEILQDMDVRHRKSLHKLRTKCHKPLLPEMFYEMTKHDSEIFVRSCEDEIL